MTRIICSRSSSSRARRLRAAPAAPVDSGWWIWRNAHVRPTLPNQVGVVVEERVPTVVWDTGNHQVLLDAEGLALKDGAGPLPTEELLLKKRGPHAFVVVLDGVEDPHNLGAIIRTAEGAGAEPQCHQCQSAVSVSHAA